MNVYTIVFLVLLAAVTLCRLWLSSRQTRNIRQHRSSVPSPFDSRISLEDHKKAADYAIARGRLGRLETLFDALLLCMWTLGGGFALLDGAVRGLGWGNIATGLGFVMSFSIIGSLLGLPFSVFNTFGIEERFGFNRTTPRLFVIDMLKGLVVSLLLGAPLLAAVLWFMANAGAYWWIYAWLVWAGFSLLLTWAYPTFIAPWFNRFEALEDRDLQSRIEALLQRCGFRSSGVFVMDGSRRSSHGNAYFTGLGAAKRIVFFDTLLKSLEPPEIEAVLAHELGHFRRHHIRKRLVTMLALGLAALGMLGWLKLQPGFYSGLGFSAVSDYAALTLFMVVAPLAGYFASPLAALLSRKHEFEADAFAVEHSDGPALIAALVKLYRDNATTLTPDRLHSLFYDSHPPAPIRIEHIEALVGRR